jgi:hypothetical protein
MRGTAERDVRRDSLHDDGELPAINLASACLGHEPSGLVLVARCRQRAEGNARVRAEHAHGPRIGPRDRARRVAGKRQLAAQPGDQGRRRLAQHDDATVDGKRISAT